MEKILTFELDQEDELVELHLNKLGAEYLKNILAKLIDSDQDEHLHLMTPEWGGDELSDNQQNLSRDAKLINQLKILYWKG